MTIELYAEQVQTIVERAGGGIMADGTPDSALSVSSLRRVLAKPAGGEISSALVRGLLVLAAFPVDGTPRRLGEIATELDMNTSTVHRCLATLVAVGLLERDRETRRYSRRGRLSV